MNFNNRTFFYPKNNINIYRQMSLSYFTDESYITDTSCKIVYYAPMNEKTLTVHPV